MTIKKTKNYLDYLKKREKSNQILIRLIHNFQLTKFI